MTTYPPIPACCGPLYFAFCAERTRLRGLLVGHAAAGTKISPTKEVEANLKLFIAESRWRNEEQPSAAEADEEIAGTVGAIRDSCTLVRGSGDDE